MESDPRLMKFSPIANWEDGIENEATAESYYWVVERRLAELGISIPRGATVLDVGSGNNIFTDFLKKQGLHAFGIDARPRGENINSNIIQGRAEKMPFPSGTFDFIFSSGLFDLDVYKQDHQQMMDEIARVLKPGGIYAAIGNFNMDAQFKNLFETLLDGRHYAIYRKKN